MRGISLTQSLNDSSSAAGQNFPATKQTTDINCASTLHSGPLQPPAQTSRTQYLEADILLLLEIAFRSPPKPSQSRTTKKERKKKFDAKMKLLTLNFLTCARKACKTSAAAFPLHPRDAELEVVETELNLPFISNILPRLDWEALRTLAAEVRHVRARVAL